MFTAKGPGDSLGQLLVFPCLAITVNWKSQQPQPDQSKASKGADRPLRFRGLGHPTGLAKVTVMGYLECIFGFLFLAVSAIS